MREYQVPETEVPSMYVKVADVERVVPPFVGSYFDPLDVLQLLQRLEIAHKRSLPVSIKKFLLEVSVPSIRGPM